MDIFKYPVDQKVYPDAPSWMGHNLWERHEAHEREPAASRYRQAAERLCSFEAKQVWKVIATTYGSADSLAFELVEACGTIRADWDADAKRTPSEHREHMLRQKANALALANEVDRWIPGHWAEQPINITQYLTEDEEAAVGLALGRDGENWDLLLTTVPTIPELLRRIAKDFDTMSRANPISTRPKSENAERNYFVRRMCIFFNITRGHASPRVVAGVTALFFPQGIDENEVSQRISALRRKKKSEGSDEDRP